MNLSVITATYNSSTFVAQCIKSIKNQTYSDIEHIIIDGKSKDNTLEIIKTTPNRITKIISEPDNGIYDAMNKGIQLASGDVVGILNSDDFYASDTIIEEIVNIFEATSCDCVYGNLDFVKAEEPQKVIRRWKSSPFVSGSFSKGWHPPHPTFFVRREIYEKYGTFDTSLNVSADFELMLRFLEKYQIKHQYIDKTIVNMRYGGESTGSLKKIIEGNKNIMKAFRKNNIPVSPFYPIIRLLPKLKQFITK
ncbi:glycosyltransferase family 2 protein [Prolixibacter sp. NT017]|uniref:glycosyltransferase family 2 protein n=1 Tax=Prolixibacter sp. NT017 TaxID=2652390 RepID=UPI001289BAAC|nr:glycosyltransferase family 2 protein [Prolixibacter sp. NT017]GET24190.1 glycosyl transferase [Prolixibacter sp. NT017]